MNDERPDDAASDFLGARLGEENRLVLVPLDPDRPWAAFRRMRAWMKRAPKSKRSGGAQVIPLRRNDSDR